MNGKWYVIRTVTNKEKKCKEQVEAEIRLNGYDGYVNQLVIPTEKVYKIRKGKKVSFERNYYPGYILIETDPLVIGELKRILKGINFVSGFLGDPEPIALKDDEVARILNKMDELAVTDESFLDDYMVGEDVKVIDGPFNTFVGRITDVNSEKKRLKINVKIFGRETPLEVNFGQVTKDI